MRKLILFFLVAMTFFGTTTVMAKPAFTDISIQASTADWNSSDTKSEFTTPDEKVEDSVPSETPEQPNISIKQPHQHQFNVQSQNPTCTKPGYTKEVCECGMMKNNIVLPSIQHAYDKKVKHPTCTSTGFAIYTCKMCGDSFESDYEDIVPHKFSAWNIVKAATPKCDGAKTRVCSVCSYTEHKVYQFQFVSENAIFIERAGLHAEFNIADLTQKSVDTYDIVYAISNQIDEPFILGHNTRSLKTLHKTRVGDTIYINKNGEVLTYIVRVSEYAITNEYRTSMIGQTTGHSIWDKFDNETLHVYTCHGPDDNGRWMILAELITK